jgi:hypothetical protein
MNEILVVYIAINKKGEKTIGNCSVSTSASLPLSKNNIEAVEKGIAEQNEHKNVVLLNYLVLGQEEGADNG